MCAPRLCADALAPGHGKALPQQHQLLRRVAHHQWRREAGQVLHKLDGGLSLQGQPASHVVLPHDAQVSDRQASEGRERTADGDRRTQSHQGSMYSVIHMCMLDPA
jgi:hypothetical protein